MSQSDCVQGLVLSVDHRRCRVSSRRAGRYTCSVVDSRKVQSKHVCNVRLEVVGKIPATSIDR